MQYCIHLKPVRGVKNPKEKKTQERKQNKITTEKPKQNKLKKRGHRTQGEGRREVEKEGDEEREREREGGGGEVGVGDRNGQTGRQTDRRTDRQTVRQACRQTDRQRGERERGGVGSGGESKKTRKLIHVYEQQAVPGRATLTS